MKNTFELGMSCQRRDNVASISLKIIEDCWQSLMTENYRSVVLRNGGREFAQNVCVQLRQVLIEKGFEDYFVYVGSPSSKDINVDLRNYVN